MNIRFLGQIVLQVTGLNYATVKYRNKDIDSIDSYVPKVEYPLPFDGEWYTGNGGVTKNTSHSWEILPQRFAYDFIIVDEEGESYRGDKKDLRSYYCYGKDILAPADGVIASIKSNFSDCRIMSDGQTDPDTPDIGGNSGNITEPHVHFQVQNTAHFYSCIGLPIIFSNIQKRLYAKYNMIDARPLPEKEDIKDGYIYRGLLVKN